MVVRGCRGYSDHKITEFSMFGDTRRGFNKTSALDFWKADFWKAIFSLFRMLISEYLGKQPLKIKESRKDRCISRKKS